MIRSENEMYAYGDYVPGSSLSVFEDPQRDMIGSQFRSVDGVETLSGFPEVQMKPIYESSYSNASVRVSSMMTEPLTNIFEVENYNSLTEHERVNTPMMLNHWTPEEESTSNVTRMNTDCQQSEHSSAFLPRSVTNNNDKHIQSEYHGKMKKTSSPSTPSTHFPKKSKRSSKEGHLVTVQNRQFCIAERMQALQELLPAELKVNQHSVQANRESVLDNAIGYIRHLELQLKEMSGSRLGGESICSPLLYVEGLGHYYPHGNNFEEPLEEVFGELIEELPRVANKLLKSKGLHMVPIDSVDALRRADSNLQ